MYTKPALSQKECDPKKPDEHFLWALRNMPSFAGAGVITHVGFLRTWSKHLWECGFAHRDYLASLADADGNIHVSKLPKQQIKFQEAFRGPHHHMNQAARWVKMGEKDPEPVVIQDVSKLTQQEQQAYLLQFKALGMVPEGTVEPPKGEVVP